KRAYCLKTQPATGETYPKSDLFNKAEYVLQESKKLKNGRGWSPQVSLTSRAPFFLATQMTAYHL
ncbi:hypothetical protein VBQ06_26015, partial [Klebsiella pneumoniae]|nr:hypothetical protein [Klebsiella pneumoniae]MEA4601724.1 hypothetical protein [Klebsiella pneumoniae]